MLIDALGCSMDDHHDPLCDARAVVEVIRGLARTYDVQDLNRLADAVGVRIGHMHSGIYRGSVAVGYSEGGLSRLARAE